MDLMPFMKRHNMLPPPGGRILCAVSGGRDSVCLLHYLWQLGQREDFSVAAVHMDHGQRETARRDVRFVQELCRERNIPCVIERVSVPEKAREWGVGVEEAGRRLRYETVRRAAEKTRSHRIATAHHAADQAETVLLNLLRGTGPQGLAGIPPVRDNIIRPLLETSRQEIEAYLAENGLEHVEDETNQDTALTRNRLRLTIMPLLRDLYPGAERSICRTAEILRREEDCWQAQVAAVLPERGTEMDRQTLLDLPYALRLRVLRALTERTGTGRKDYGAVHYESMERLLHGPGGLLHLPGGVTALCRDGTFSLERETAVPETVRLPIGETRWGAYTIFCEKTDRSRLPPENALALRDDVLIGGLTVGPCRPGGGLCLPGSRGRRSVKRLCADRGIDPITRDQLPAIYVGGSLAALWPLGTDKEFLPRETDGEMIVIYVKRETSGGENDG